MDTKEVRSARYLSTLISPQYHVYSNGVGHLGKFLYYNTDMSNDPMTSLIDHITNKTMLHFGNPPFTGNSHSDIEWDLSRSDSQISMIREEVEFIVGEVFRAFEPPEVYSLRLAPPDGRPLTVSDVREWLAQVDNLHIPDDREVVGELEVLYSSEESEDGEHFLGESGSDPLT